MYRLRNGHATCDRVLDSMELRGYLSAVCIPIFKITHICNLLSITTSKSNFKSTYDFYSYQISDMSSPINKVFGNDATPTMPEAPKQNNDRRASDASVGSESFYNGRRRVR